jgi:hypothetical protein
MFLSDERREEGGPLVFLLLDLVINFFVFLVEKRKKCFSDEMPNSV